MIYIKKQETLGWLIITVFAVALAVLFWMLMYPKKSEAIALPKVDVCHCEQVDSESPFQCQTLNIAIPAAIAHLAQHEADYSGACEAEEPYTQASYYSQASYEDEYTQSSYYSQSSYIEEEPYSQSSYYTQAGYGSTDGGDGLGCSTHECSARTEVINLSGEPDHGPSQSGK